MDLDIMDLDTRLASRTNYFILIAQTLIANMWTIQVLSCI